MTSLPVGCGLHWSPARDRAARDARRVDFRAALVLQNGARGGAGDGAQGGEDGPQVMLRYGFHVIHWAAPRAVLPHFCAPAAAFRDRLLATARSRRVRRARSASQNDARW